jgi:hypothetical protein
MDVMLNQDDRIEIFDDDYRLVAFPHIFLFWNVLFFTNDGQHQYFFRSQQPGFVDGPLRKKILLSY